MNVKRTLIGLILLTLQGLFSGLLQANENDERISQIESERKRLLQTINRIRQDPPSYARAIAAGSDRSLLCSNCHGQDGNSILPDTPNLASQNPAYLLEQLELFSSGERRNFVMESLASTFTTEDKINLAIFYSSMPVQPVEFNPGLLPAGKVLFNSLCFICHGNDGKGEEGFARIAGQNPIYTIGTLQRYRANAQGKTDPEERTRTDQRMEQVTHHLSNDDIEALANYIASLR